MRNACIEGTYFIKAPQEEVYELLTDFANFPIYFPRLVRSVRVISRDGNHLVIRAQTKAFWLSKVFDVDMDTTLQPENGFTSINTSSVGTEHESMRFERVPGGTRIVYRNEFQLDSLFFRLFGCFVKGIIARYWERVMLGKIREMLETEQAG